MYVFINTSTSSNNLSLYLEAENCSVVSDYHPPVQQSCLSGALKLTRVEQMAQFSQSFQINEPLLQRNANFQTPDCFLLRGGRKKKIFRSRLNTPCSRILRECSPFIMKALLAFGSQSSGLVCGKSAQFGSGAMLQCSEVTQLPVCYTLMSLHSYVGQVSQKSTRAKWVGTKKKKEKKSHRTVMKNVLTFVVF